MELLTSEREFLLCLSEDIMLNIISRLPFESVLDCRLVCKTWRKNLPLIHSSSTYFADMHLRRRLSHNKNSESTDTKLSFVCLRCSYSYKYLYYMEYDENDVQYYNGKHKKFKLPPVAYGQSLVGSSNGLICFAARTFECFAHDPIYVCNPITREFVHLPEFIDSKKQKYSSITHGFGYHPSTNEYKVVRVMNYRYDQDTSTGQVQVYTLGSGMGWRYKGEISHRMLLAISPHGLLSTHGILFNGALHWLTSALNIVAFDLVDEEFRCLPKIPASSPPYFYKRKLWMVDGWLCIVNQKTNFDAEIWLFKKKNDEKHGTSRNELSWGWSREFTITFDEGYGSHQPFFITKRGEILLLCEGKSIICCDPKPAAKLKKLGDFGQTIIGCYESVVSHFNSFVSLKALGEDAEIV